MMKYWIVLGAMMAWWSGETQAQEPAQKDEIRVRVIRQKDGKTTVEERIISAGGMTAEERTRRIDSAVDSLMKGPNKRVKVIIEDGKEAEIQFDDSNDDMVFQEPKKGRMLMEFDTRDFRNRMRRLGDEIPEKIDQFGPVHRWDNQLFRDWGQTPFRGVEIYPNKPANEILNLRFYAENEGDVVIRVLDLQGKEVASETIPNHQGEYIGQVRIKRANAGTYFVLLTQGKDGISRRVVL